MDPVRDLLGLTADYASQFIGSLDERPVPPQASVEELRAALGGPLPEHATDAAQVVAELIEAAEPGIMAMPSGRFFGFVIGGALPVCRRSRLAHVDLGSERRPDRTGAECRRRRGGRARVAA